MAAILGFIVLLSSLLSTGTKEVQVVSSYLLLLNRPADTSKVNGGDVPTRVSDGEDLYKSANETHGNQ